eukprot:UN09741
MTGLFIDPAPLYSTNDPANYKRVKIFFFAVVPVLISLYFHFGDMLLPTSASYSQIVRRNKEIKVPENQLDSKEFELFNPTTNEYIFFSIVRDSDTCSSDNLDQLLEKWGLRIKAKDINLNEKEKIDLLLMISSPSFWRMNYLLHPKRPRVKHWLSVHQRYLNEIESFKQLDRAKMKTDFIKFINQLKIHSEFEDLMLFKFLKEYMQLDIVDVFSKEHESIQQQATHIIKLLENDDSDSDIM